MQGKTLIVALLIVGIAAVFSLGIVFSSDVALAQGLVPCGGEGQDPCSACHIAVLADNLLKFFTIAAVIVATIAFVFAGFLYLTAAPNPAQIERAHKIFWNVLIGLVIVLSSFLVVDIIMRSLTGQPLTVWTDLSGTCSSESQRSTSSSNTRSGSGFNPENNPEMGGGRTNGIEIGPQSNGAAPGASSLPEPEVTNETYRISAVADVTYTSGASGRISVSLGPFSSQAACYAALGNPTAYVSGTTEVTFVSFSRDCDTPVQ